jgi:hypothetical protein
MACFFRVWKTPSFCCQDSTNKDAVLPISVQAQLRTIVQRGLHSIEHNVLRELDSMITPMGQPRFHDKLPLWACLWQLILIYRELTAASRAWLSRSEQGRSDQLTGEYFLVMCPENVADHMGKVAIHTRYKYLFENLFPLVSVFYHYQFRTKRSVELSLDWLKKPSEALESGVKHLMATRTRFRESTLRRNTWKVRQLLNILYSGSYSKIGRGN